MKNKLIKRRLWAAVLAGCVIASALTGCGKNETSEDESSSVEAEVSAQEESEEVDNEEFDPRSVTEGVTLTIALQDDFIPVEDYETNLLTKQIEEDLGVNLDFISFPEADFLDKLNVMVMSGDKLPDMIFFGGGTQVSVVDNWVQEGAILELSEFYNNPDYAKNIDAYKEECGIDFTKWLRNADGEVYVLPMWTHSEDDTSKKLWVYKPWLDAVGLDVPKTTEEFYEACKAIVAADPNGNGKADEIGLTGDALGINDDYWFDVMMSGYVYACDPEYRVLEDGEISLAYTSDEWKEGLKYIKRFFDEGLIPKETLTQDQAQYHAQLYGEEQTVFSFGWFYYDGTDYETGKDYTYITALEGPEGVCEPHYVAEVARAGGAITTDCENPEAAFLVADYLCSREMGIARLTGEQGVDWDFWADAEVEDKSAYTATYPGYEISYIDYTGMANWVFDVQNKTIGAKGPWINWRPDAFGQAIATNLEEDENATWRDKIRTIYRESYLEVLENVDSYERIEYIPLTTEETNQIVDIKANLKTYLIESTSAFLAGTMDIEEDWDTYMAEMEKIGYQTVVDVYQTAYDRMEK